MSDPVVRRVNAQTWDERGGMPLIEKIATASVELLDSRSGLSSEDYRSKMETFQADLMLIDVLARAAELQGGKTVVEDLAEMQEQIQRDTAAAEEARVDIARLEKKLASEKRARSRRVQYANLAKVIVKEPSRTVSRAKIATESVGMAALDSEQKQIAKRKSAAAKQFQLLVQSSLDLEALSKKGFFVDEDDKESRPTTAKDGPNAQSAKNEVADGRSKG